MDFTGLFNDVKGSVKSAAATGWNYVTGAVEQRTGKWLSGVGQSLQASGKANVKEGDVGAMNLRGRLGGNPLQGHMTYITIGVIALAAILLLRRR